MLCLSCFGQKQKKKKKKKDLPDFVRSHFDSVTLFPSLTLFRNKTSKQRKKKNGSLFVCLIPQHIWQDKISLNLLLGTVAKPLSTFYYVPHLNYT